MNMESLREVVKKVECPKGDHQNNGSIHWKVCTLVCPDYRDAVIKAILTTVSQWAEKVNHDACMDCGCYSFVSSALEEIVEGKPV